ncbi:MAG: hypothetical protein IKP98_00085 [Bacilli bacterium]|nr:hypothetical protein [Bacilli bacterium]
MKKKIVFLIALVAVILSVGYSVKADICTYQESSFPSKDLMSTCNSICKNGLTDSSQTMKCNTWCSSKTYGLSIDKSCYCLSQNMPSEGKKCYEGGIIDMLKQQGIIVSQTQYIENQQEEQNTAAMETACKAIAGCSAGNSTAEIQQYNKTYENCMSTTVTCDTSTTCANKLCESKYKGNVFCEVGTDPQTYCNKRAQSNKNVAYSYGAGASGTKGTISEDLDYISKITVKNCFGFGEIVYYTSLVIKILQITAPIILIIWASIDLLKSVIGGDEKKIMEMRKPIIQRFISAAAIFLVPWLVSTIVNNFSSNADWLVCWRNNRYTYSRDDDEYKGSGYVNSVHDQSKEKTYINYSCTTKCHGKNITNCKELCMNTYWESSINCYNSTIDGKTDTESIETGRTKCYDEFAEEAVKIIKDKSQN